MGKKRVTFGNVRTKFVTSHRIENYDWFLERRVGMNRKLRKTERYMKLHHLLSTHEYLTFIHYQCKHVNSQSALIEYVAKRRGFIERDEYVQIER
jgi:hypothetical protein